MKRYPTPGERREMSVSVEIQTKDGFKTVDLNRRRAIRERCLNCSAWSPKEVTECAFTDCQLYPFRSGQGKQNAKARSEAIRAYCSWCMGGHRPSSCVVTYCPLFCYRQSRTERPSLSKKGHIRGSFEEREALRV